MRTDSDFKRYPLMGTYFFKNHLQRLFMGIGNVCLWAL